MNANSLMESVLQSILEVIKPLREDWAVRTQIVEELKNVAVSIDSFRGATVEPFGSFASNLFSRWGDLDISIVLTNGSCLSSAAKKRKQNLLREFLRALRKRDGWRRLQFVPHARVPILKFESGRQNISCDVSIDNLQGHIKSMILFWIHRIDGRFRDMVLLVKEWAKAHNINNPKSGTLNSYSFSLLVIFHFQTCVPAILPPLREIYPRSVVDDLTGVRSVAEEQIKEICNANITRYISDRNRAVNRSTLSELFISFLAKFSVIHTKATELGICTFTGQWQDIKSTTRWLPKTYALFIEDPFEQPENTARAVSAGNLELIAQAFQTTYHTLGSGNQNRFSLLQTLVKPDIVSFVTGTHLRNPSYPPMHFHGPHQQMKKAVYTPSQVPHQSQNLRKEKHPNHFNKQRQESYSHNLHSQHPMQRQGNQNHPESVGLERHPNYFISQRPEIHADNYAKRRQETNFDNLNKRRLESNANTFNGQKYAQQHYGQAHYIWRPKSNGQGQTL